MNRVALFSIAIVAATAAAWLALASTGPRASAPDERRDGRTGEAPRAGGPPGLASAPGGVIEAVRAGCCAIVGLVRRNEGPAAALVDVRFLREPLEGRTAGSGSTASLLRWLAVPALPSVATANAIAGADGRFVVEGLAPGLYRVTAAAEDGARGGVEVALPVDGARTQADVVLGRGAETLAGRVVHSDGRPFAGAAFVAQAPRAHEPWPTSPGAPVSLGADGRFVATGLPRGEAVVTAIENGLSRTSSGRVTVPHPGEFVLTVGADATLREGRVVAADDGSPIAGATVVGGAMSSEGGLVLERTSTDAEGRFRIPLSGSDGGLRAMAHGFAPSRTPLSELPRGKEGIEIRLARGASLSGRVTAAAGGRPVAGVAVRVVPDRRDTAYFPPDPATTDADGRYLVADLPAGEAIAFAEGGGWVTKGVGDGDALRPPALSVSLVAGKAETLDLDVVKAASATGVVLDATGAPVAGAVVSAQGRQSPTSYWWLGAIENTRVEATATAADGTFAVEGLVGGANYVFAATAPDGAKGRSAFVRASGDAPVRVEIRFVPERTIEVTVLDAASGAPVAGASVRAEPEDRAFLDEENAFATTTADGKASLRVRCSGALDLDVNADGYKSDARTPVVAASESSAVVRLERGFLVTGRVLLPDGSPASYADVEARSEEGNPGDPGIFGTRTDRSGEFRLTFASAGARTIRAKALSGGKELQAAAVAEAGGEPVTLTLVPAAQAKPAPGALVVRVVGPDGSAVPRARVRLAGPNGWENEVRDGRAEFRAKERNESWVDVWDAASADGTPLPLGYARVGPVAARTDEVTVRLPPEKAIEGWVRGPDGKGVRGASVTARSLSADEAPIDSSAGATTDAAGAFRIGRLSDGPVTLDADVPPEFVRPDPVASRGGATGVEIRLKAGVSVAVTVLDDAGEPVADASVTASTGWRSGARGYGEARTDSNGVAHLVGLDPALAYCLEVEVWSSRPRLHSSSRDDWKPVDTTVRLGRSLSVKGTVRDPAGHPMAGACVWASDDSVSWGPTKTGMDGTFTIGGLAAGEVVLRVSIEGNGGGAAAETRVTVGTEGVVLTLDPGLDLVVRVTGWPVGAPSTAATLFEQGAGEPTYASARIAADGTARVRGLLADRAYTLWIPPLPDGRSLLTRDVRVGTGAIAVTLAPGKTIRGRLVVPAGAKVRGLFASREGGFMTVPGTWTSDGAYEIAGLPETAWTVSATAARGDERFRGEADAPAGGTVDVVLR